MLFRSLALGAGKSATAPVFVTGPREAFEEGRRDVRLRIDDGAGWSTVAPYRLLGPDEDDHERKHEHEREGGHER